MLAVLPPLVVATDGGALLALAASPAPYEHRAALLVRQTLTPSAGCVSACTTFAKDGLLFAGSLSAICSSTFLDAYAQCYDCMVGADLIMQTVAQDIIDSASLLHRICALIGHTVSSVTITGSSTGSNGTTATGCVSACTAVAQDAQAAAGSTTALCTSTFDDTFVVCFDCMVDTDLITQNVAQDVMDGHVQRCAVNGFTLSSVTITSGPLGSSGTTATSAAAASSSSGSTGSDPNGFHSSAEKRLRRPEIWKSLVLPPSQGSPAFSASQTPSFSQCFGSKLLNLYTGLVLPAPLFRLRNAAPAHLEDTTLFLSTIRMGRAQLSFVEWPLPVSTPHTVLKNDYYGSIPLEYRLSIIRPSSKAAHAVVCGPLYLVISQTCCKVDRVFCSQYAIKNEKE
ncbi:hypothetical protein B0H10DRAFT_1960242 [Mycena sp. CBHHK59/15]|nr:hypothetical protein B0H10DRAFT_1960242 [Mycena sp. CBHHK59/15]